MGDWRETGKVHFHSSGTTNIFKLYEENIGPLNTDDRDALKRCRDTFSPEWIAEQSGMTVKK